VELNPVVLYSSSVVSVDYINDTMCVLVVVSPKSSDFVTSTDIPKRKIDVLVLDILHVKSNRRNSCHDFTQLEFVESSSLASSIETEHQDTKLGALNLSLKRINRVWLLFLYLNDFW